MPSIGSKKAFLQAVVKSLKTSAEATAPKLSQVVQNSADTIVYNVYKPEIYERTESLKKAVDSKISTFGAKSIEMLVFHNPAKSSHTSVLDYIIDEQQFPGIIVGGAFPLFGAGIWTQPRDYWEHARKEIEQKTTIKKNMVENMKKLGWGAK